MIKLRSNSIFLLLYTLFIIYGSLFPLVDWRSPTQNLLVVWQQAMGQHLSRSDLLTNILVYIPLGFLLCSVCSQRLGTFSKVVLTVILGGMLSFAMEYIQLFLPARTSSPVDLILNVMSTIIGAISFCWLGKESSIGEVFIGWRNSWFISEKIADIGIMVVVLWVAVQLAPFVPSLDVGDIKNGLRPLWLTLHDLSRFNCYRVTTYALNISSLGVGLLLITKLRSRVPILLGVFCGTVLLVKILIVGRQLSLEAVAGLIIGFLLTFLIQRLSRGGLITIGGCSVVFAYVVDVIRPDPTTVELHPFNWIPFGSQMMENVSGIGSILDGLWPFVAFGFFAIMFVYPDRLRSVFKSGAFIVLGVFVLEYYQTFITGRYADITSVILAVVGWSIPLLLFRDSKS
jgi:VanZ family protein